MPKKKVCENADKNPLCPYLTQINQINDHITSTSAAVAASVSATNTAMLRINQQGDDISAIKKALIGGDMSKVGGIVKRLDDIEDKLKSRLTGRDKAVIYGALITAAVAVLVELIRGLL